MNLPDQLRAAIAERHRAIEATPLALNMMNGELDRTTYGWWLTQMQQIHSVVEMAAREATFLNAWPMFQTMDRAAVITRDLQALNVTADYAIEECVTEFLDTIERESAAAPERLLGVLYVLEGSRMGSLMLARPIAKALGIPMESGVGLDYHVEEAKQRPQLWQQFRGQLGQVPISVEQQQNVIDTAVATMTCLCDLYEQKRSTPELATLATA